MPRYLIARAFEVTEEQMPPVGRRSRELTETEFPEIVWEHSHVVVDDEGLVHTYCVYEAPDEEAILQHAQQLGEHEYWVQEIVGDVTPDDFPLNGDEPPAAA